MFLAVGSLFRRPPIRWEKIAPISTSIALPSRDGHYGISAKGLKDFMTRNQVDKSKKTRDVVEEIVKPTTNSEISYCNWMETCSTLKKDIGEPTVYVSHVWDYKFYRLVSAINSFDELKSFSVQYSGK